jgi:LacI family transcriptional regulator
MAITLREVAKHSKVSISTASRALNGRLDVSKDVRARVLAAAQDLNYAANLHARALKGATSKTLGVILHDTGALAFSAALMGGIYDAATPRGFSVIVCNASSSPDVERRAHQMLIEKRVDGVLLNSIYSGTGPLKRLQDSGIPFVLLNRHLDDEDPTDTSDYVTLDYRQGTYLATQHLLELGHRHILYQLGPKDHSPSMERLPGYIQAHRDHGVPYFPERVVFCEGMAETHLRVRELMTLLDPRPTAVMAYNDESALPVLKALHDLGLRVPEDIAVVGQNDLQFAPYLIPPLTTVAHAVYEVGRQGAEILFQKLRWPEDEPWTPHRIIRQPTLVIRESSGHPFEP